jgi:hypothetical protein
MPNMLADKKTRLRYNRRMREKGVPAKACGKCFAIKGLEAFHRNGDGYMSACKVCDNERTAERYANNREAVLAQKADPDSRARKATYDAERNARNTERNRGRVQDSSKTKRCGGKCGRMLPETSFSLGLCRADGLRSKCRDCDHGAYRNSCRSTHGDPVGLICYLCGETITSENDAHADHLIPQSLGGGDHGYNLRWTHAACNISRGNALTTIEQYWRLHPEIAADCGLAA